MERGLRQRGTLFQSRITHHRSSVTSHQSRFSRRRKMPYAPAKGARLYYEEAGRGTAIVFAHEFSGDFRSWEAQMRFFSRRYRCIAYNARGYPPSEVPPTTAYYSHITAVDDMRAVMRHLGVAK